MKQEQKKIDKEGCANSLSRWRYGKVVCFFIVIQNMSIFIIHLFTEHKLPRLSSNLGEGR